MAREIQGGSASASFPYTFSFAFSGVGFVMKDVNTATGRAVSTEESGDTSTVQDDT